MRFRPGASSRVINLVALAVAAALSGLPAFATETHRFDIPEESASAAIRDFGAQAHVQVLVAGEYVKNRKLHAVSGNLSTYEALDKMLEGSGLTQKYVGDGSIALIPVSLSSDQSRATGSAQPNELGKGGGGSSGNFLLAQAAQGQMAGAPAVASAASNPQAPENEVPIQQVVVTAEKKAERVQDVPMAVTVVNPDELAQNGQNRFVDYFASVPGLNVSSGGNGLNYITIRGLSAGANQSPLVATVIDDVPATSAVVRGAGGITAPELDPSDLARIEVLKGPQGTLYGADSLGGLIKYVTVDPSTAGWSGRAEVSGEDIPGGGGGYAVRGTANIPVSDTVAMRVSAYDRQDPGYIDDLTTGQQNFNSADVYGGRVAAMWRPSENFSVKVSGLIQEVRGDASVLDSNISGQSVTPGGGLALSSLPGATQYVIQNQLYSATVDWRVAGLEITSVTGYVVNVSKNWGDYTAALGALFYDCQQPGGCFVPANPPGVDGAAILTSVTTHKVSEELRVGSSVGSWLDWRFGGFYTHEARPSWDTNFYPADLSTGAISYLGIGTQLVQDTFREYAGFGDVTAHITDRFDVELGGRDSWNKQVDQAQDTGQYTNIFDGAPPPFLYPLVQASGSAFTYQVTPKFKISPDLMTYARVATGYRIGGYNLGAFEPLLQGYGIPPSFAPDKTTNYELGLKGVLLDHTLSFDAAAYYIDWKNFQVLINRTLTGPGGSTIAAGYTANAGNAKSEGLELSLEAHPLKGLTVAAEGSYDNAVLTQTLPCCSVYGVAGDRLPYSMRLSGGLSANQDIRLSTDWLGFVGAAVNYVGSRPQEFTANATTTRIMYAPYTQLNLRSGARYESWLINLYLNNVTDKRGVVGIAPSYSLGNPGGYDTTVIQPRTLGLVVSRTF